MFVDHVYNLTNFYRSISFPVIIHVEPERPHKLTVGSEISHYYDTAISKHTSESHTGAMAQKHVNKYETDLYAHPSCYLLSEKHYKIT